MELVFETDGETVKRTYGLAVLLIIFVELLGPFQGLREEYLM